MNNQTTELLESLRKWWASRIAAGIVLRDAPKDAAGQPILNPATSLLLGERDKAVQQAQAVVRSQCETLARTCARDDARKLLAFAHRIVSEPDRAPNELPEIRAMLLTLDTSDGNGKADRVAVDDGSKRWSFPMQKKIIAERLGFLSVRRFNKASAEYELKKINRKLFRLRIDTLDAKIQGKFDTDSE